MTRRQTAVPAREPPPGQEPPPGGTAPGPALAAAVRGPALARLLLAALLIGGVLVGLRGGFALHGWRGPYHRDGIAIGIGLEAVLASLLMGLLIRGRRPSDDFRVLRIRSVLRFALLAGLVTIPAVLLLAAPLHPHPLPPQPLPAQPQPTVYSTPTRPAHPSAPFRLPLTGVLYALLVLALIGGIVVCVVLLRRRQHRQIQVGASPRGGLSIIQLARGQALLRLRDYVIPDDIKSVTVPALAHRITLRPELWVRQVKPDDVVAGLLASVPTPRTDPSASRA